MKTLPRSLRIRLPAKQSAFLWGPRKTGKSTYLRQTFPKSLTFDFLKTDVFFEFSKDPSRFREQILAQKPSVLNRPIILDEVQKVPQVLDEVHYLIEQKGLRFILCGSSARKLKRGKANLLGGRAWRYEMFPLVFPEVEQFDLIRVLNHGLIPSHYLENNARKSLVAYVQDYLKEEVFEEGLTRNIPAFSRFFDAMGYSHGELTNYANIARDCGVDVKTVKEYYQILVDTFLGYFLEPYKKRQNRQVITRAPKFYLFDVGVAGAITKRRITEERGEAFGRALEHLILLEMIAYRSYREKDFAIRFWRTKSGKEVDFVLGDGEVAVEVKGARHVGRSDLLGLAAFRDDHSPKKSLLVCTEKAERIHDGIRILPWKNFLRELWEGNVI